MRERNLSGTAVQLDIIIKVDKHMLSSEVLRYIHVGIQ